MREINPATDWLVCCVVAPTALILPHDPFSVGAFELTRRVDPFPGCEDSLRQSAAEHGEAVDLSRCWLMKAFFLNERERSVAVRSARLFAREALVLFEKTLMFPVGKLSLMKSGYAVDLKMQAVSAIVPTARERFLGNFGMVAMLDEVEHHPLGVVNRLLSSDPKHFGELGQALRRSTHWSSLSGQLEDEGERVLVQWMACETLTRVDENESLTPKLMAALGLPTGRYFTQLPDSERNALAKSGAYKLWRRRLNDVLDRLRDARNRIAHTGFRELELVELLGDKDVELVKRVLPMVIGRLHALALVGLEFRKATIRELWDAYGHCKLQFRHISLAHELEHTILHGLTDRDPLDE